MKKALKNEEYLSYVDYLRSVNFEQKLEILKEKYADKKVILYGTGLFLDAVLDNYDIKNYLNIIGISDKRIKEDKSYDYKGFNVYKPSALRALNFNVVLDTGILFENNKKYLRDNHCLKRGIIVQKLVQIPLTEKITNFFNKIKAVFGYLKQSKNPFLALKYLFICETREIVSKTNYIANLKRIRKSNKPIRTAFVCSDAQHTDFVGLYNLLYFDKDFNLFPIIIVPDNLLDTDEIDEEKMSKSMGIFDAFNFKIIDGVDRQTKELACLHAFKPDLIFYQNPIHIKDDFNPYKMSNTALTFSVEYFIKDANFVSMGSKYFRKQVSDLWKIFVGNKEERNLYSEYTDIQNKDIVKIINRNINSGIVKYLKKCLKRN